MRQTRRPLRELPLAMVACVGLLLTVPSLPAAAGGRDKKHSSQKHSSQKHSSQKHSSQKAAAGGTAEPPATLAEIIRRAAAEKLPLEPLRNKISEGKAKGVPLGRIEAVVGRLAHEMREARRWLERGQRRPAAPGLLVAVAQARLAGVPLADVRELAPPGAGDEVADRIDVLADLHLRGYHGVAARQLVRAARPSELPALGRACDETRRATSLSHAEVVDLLLREMTRGKGSLTRATRTLGHGAARGNRPADPNASRSKKPK